MPVWFLWLLQLVIFHQSQGHMDHLIPLGKSVDFLYMSEVYIESQLVSRTKRAFEAANHNDVFTITADDQGTDSTLALIFDGSTLTNIKVSDKEVNNNYKKSMASLFMLPQTWKRREIHPVNDSMGECEWDITTGETVTVTRDLSLCSHTFPGHVDTSIIKFPVLPLVTDTFGSVSKCEYSWMPDKRQISNIHCNETVLVGARFTEPKVKMEIISSVKIKDSARVGSRSLTNINDMDFDQGLTHHSSISSDEGTNIPMNEVIILLCEGKALTIELLLNEMPLFMKALKNQRNPMMEIPPKCPSYIRRFILLSAALESAHYLEDILEQTKVLDTLDESLVPPYMDPIFALAFANLGIQRAPLEDTFLRYEELMSMVSESPMSIAGVSALINGMITEDPFYQNSLKKDFDINKKISVACTSDVEEAAMVLHATSKLLSRGESFFNSTAPCFASDDPVVHLAVLNSLRDMRCIEITQKAQIGILQSVVDPELKIAAFQGLIKCNFSEKVIDTVSNIFKEDSESYSRQVASYAYSYIQAIVHSSDPAVKSVKKTFVENSLDKIQSPITYDIRQHSRRIEYFWKLDEKNGILFDVDIVWNRASPFPSSVTVNTKVINEDGSFPFFNVGTRIAGLGNFVWKVPYLETLWKIFTADSKEELLRYLQSSIKDVWSKVGGLTKETVLTLVNKYKSNRPFQYKLGRTNVQLSLDLFGQPVYQKYISNLSIFISQIWKYMKQIPSKYDRNEFWNLAPLLQQSMPIVTASGIPIRLKTSWHSIIKAVYSKVKKGSFHRVEASLGLAFKTITDLVIGKDLKFYDSFPIKYSGGTRVTEDFKITRSSEVFLDLPIEYEAGLVENKLQLRVTRPHSQPHNIFRSATELAMNTIPLYPKHTIACLLEKSFVNVCYERISHLDELPKMFQSGLLEQQQFSLNFHITRGIGPVTIAFDHPSKSRDRTSHPFSISLQSEDGYQYYPGALTIHKSSIQSYDFMVDLKQTRYLGKMFWTMKPSDSFKAGLEGSVGEKKTSFVLRTNVTKRDSTRIWSTSISRIDSDRLEKNIWSMRKENSKTNWLFKASSSELIKQYLDFNAIATHSIRGDFTDFHAGNLLVVPALSIDIAVDTLYTLSRYNYLLDFFGRWKEDSIGLKAEWAPFKDQPVAEYLPNQVQEVLRTDLYNVSVNITHSSLFPPILASAKIELNSELFNSDWLLQVGDETGSMAFHTRPTSWTNHHNIFKIDVDGLNLHFNIAEDFVLNGKNVDSALDLSWSQRPIDAIKFYVKRYQDTEKLYTDSLEAQVKVHGYTVNLNNVLEKTVTGYNSDVRIDSSPGHSLRVKSVYIIGISAVRSSYGLSTEATSSFWDDIVLTMGTLTCHQVLNSCMLSITSRRAADSLLTVNSRVITVPEVSSQAFIELNSEKLQVNMNINSIAVFDVGDFNASVVGNLMKLNKHIEGDIHFNWNKLKDGVAKMDISRSDDLNVLSGRYTGHVNIDKVLRTLDTRHSYEDFSENSTLTWRASSNGKIGSHILGSHFGKVIVISPTQEYYSVGANVFLKYENKSVFTHVEAKLDLSCALSEAGSYIWQTTLTTIFGREVFSYPISEERYAITEEHGPTLGELGLTARVVTPGSGESKIRISSERLLVLDSNDRHVKAEGKVILVTKYHPDIGRLTWKVVQSDKSLTINTKGSYVGNELTFDSYYVNNIDHLKLYYQFNVQSPRTRWSKFALSNNLEIGGNYPDTAKILFVGFVDSMNSPKTNIKIFLVKQPEENGGEISLSSPHNFLPNGQILFKWYPDKMDCRIVHGEGQVVLVISNNGTWNTISMYGSLDFAPTNTHLEWTNNFQFLPRDKKLWKSLTHVINIKSKAFRYLYQLESHMEEYHGNHTLVVGEMSGISGVNNMVRIQVLNHGTKDFDARAIIDVASKSYGADVSLNLEAYDGRIFVVHLKKKEDSRSLDKGEKMDFYIWRNSSAIEIDLQRVSSSFKPKWNYNYKLSWSLDSKESFIDSLVAKDNLTVSQEKKLTQSYSLVVLNVEKVQEGHDIQLFLPYLNNQLFTGTLDPTDRAGEELMLTLQSATEEHSITGIFDTDPINKSLRSFKIIIFRHPLTESGYPLSIVLKCDLERYKGRFALQKLESMNGGEESLYDEPEDGRPVRITSDRLYNRTLDFQFASDKKGDLFKLDLAWETDEYVNSGEFGLDVSEGLLLSMKYAQNSQNSGVQLLDIGTKFECQHQNHALTCKFSGTSFNEKVSQISLLLPDDGSEMTALFDVFARQNDALILKFINSNEISVRLSQPNQVLFYAKEVRIRSNPHNKDIAWELNILGWSLEVQIAKYREDKNCSWTALNFGIQENIIYNSLVICPTGNKTLLATMLGSDRDVGVKLAASMPSNWRNLDLKLIPSRMEVPALALRNHLDEENPYAVFNWDSRSMGALVVFLPVVTEDLLARSVHFPNPPADLSGKVVLINFVHHFNVMMKELEQVLMTFSNEWEPLRANDVSSKVASSFGTMEAWIHKLHSVYSIVKVDALKTFQTSSKIFVNKISIMRSHRYEASKKFSDMVKAWLTIPEYLKPLPIDFMYAQVAALDENDDKTLRAVIFRYVSMLRTILGPMDGAPGVITSTLILEFEKCLQNHFTWDGMKAFRAALHHRLNMIIPFSINYEDQQVTVKLKKRDKMLAGLKESLLDSQYEYFTSTIQSWREKYPKLRTDLRFFLSAEEKGEAFVLGNLNAISFDGKVLDLNDLSICPHILVTLLNEKLTSIVIQITREMGIDKRTFMFMDQNTIIHIDEILQLEINEKVVKESHIEVGGFEITWSPRETEISHASGLSLRCFKSPNYCKITARRSLFASTAGILGVYDWDENTDYLSNQWEQLHDGHDWQRSSQLRMDTPCTRRKHIISAEQRDSGGSFQIACSKLHCSVQCTRMFSSDNKVLKGCMSKMDPTPFKEVCSLNTCPVENIYTGLCQSRWFDEAEIQIEHCKLCQKNQRILHSSANFTHEILLLGDSSCIKGADDLIQQLRKKSTRKTKIIFRDMDILRRSKIPEGVDEKIFTFSEWDPWFHVSELLDFDFSHESIKSVILFDCGNSLCSTKYEEVMKSDLVLKLLQRASPVYLVTNQGLVITNEDKVRKKFRRQLIGMDTETVYLMSHAKKGTLKGRPSLMKHLDVPESNTCAQISLESDGAIFSTKLLRKSQHHRNFHKLIAQKVEAGSQRDVLQCRICPCMRHCTVCEPVAMRPDVDDYLKEEIADETEDASQKDKDETAEDYDGEDYYDYDYSDAELTEDEIRNTGFDHLLKDYIDENDYYVTDEEYDVVNDTEDGDNGKGYWFGYISDDFPLQPEQ